MDPIRGLDAGSLYKDLRANWLYLTGLVSVLQTPAYKQNLELNTEI